ncbi:Stk1 family PASTA domain-containing Ser/Thr kinase [Haloactinomyces albus]|uniref:non-specific serine/threonine protein kinase n=1 Tax=Haloactinomyces albus TaxID=1352928 RepID=A0AAE3ZFU3_9ACTN|nr:Stk1 family PASTA domain-containing Ser/Thr kinase [Haloactinomyces albus]MDR7303106.1 serine/threonine-protein kinase [Haloactinomyces albus]
MTAETRRDRRDDLVGTMLERRYRVDSLIARGGMSAVYRGLDTRLERPVALKVMDSQYSGDRSFIERFEREARAAASLHHPDVVAVYDQGVDQDTGSDRVYLVMQLVEGGTLRDLLREQGRLPLPVAVSVLESVLSALAAAHEAGMVHRDIKPENVLIGPGGSVKVTDFGLVRAAASAGTTSGSVILGTVAYLSPEQVTTGAADARTDVYAAGVVLYEMLTGEPPYTGDTALSVAYRHVNDDVPAPGEHVPELPAAVDDLVLRATRRDPSVRPADAAAFLTELRALRNHSGMGPVAVPVPVTERQADDIDDDDDEPATDRFPPVDRTANGTAMVLPAHEDTRSGGPQGTRALSRSMLDPERAQDMSAVEEQRSDDHSADPARSRRRNRRRFAVSTLVVLLLAALVGGTAWWLGSGRYVTVPPLTGVTEATAVRALRQAELVPEVTRSYHDTVAAGTVISASPAEGSRTPRGDEVRLVVSRGKPKVPEVPPGTPVSEAQSMLRNAKLDPELDSSANRYHAEVPKGRVIGVNPAPGTPVATSATVTIIVSKGPPPVAVPDVRGSSKEEAFAALRQAGFEPYVAGRKFSSEVSTNHVLSTKPTVGTKVKLQGTPRVGVVLSNAVTVPDLTGMRVRQAQQKASDLGVQLEVKSFLNRQNGRVLGQFPLAGTKVEPGSSITVTAL